MTSPITINLKVPSVKQFAKNGPIIYATICGMDSYYSFGYSISGSPTGASYLYGKKGEFRVAIGAQNAPYQTMSLELSSSKPLTFEGKFRSSKVTLIGEVYYYEVLIEFPRYFTVCPCKGKPDLFEFQCTDPQVKVKELQYSSVTIPSQDLRWYWKGEINSGLFDIYLPDICGVYIKGMSGSEPSEVCPRLAEGTLLKPGFVITRLTPDSVTMSTSAPIIFSGRKPVLSLTPSPAPVPVPCTAVPPPVSVRYTVQDCLQAVEKLKLQKEERFKAARQEQIEENLTLLYNKIQERKSVITLLIADLQVRDEIKKLFAGTILQPEEINDSLRFQVEL